MEEEAQAEEEGAEEDLEEVAIVPEANVAEAAVGLVAQASPLERYALEDVSVLLFALLKL